MLSASAPPTSNPGSKLGTENPSCRLKNASAFRYIPALPTEKNKSLCDFVSAGDMFDLDNQPCIQSDEFKNRQERKYKIHVLCFLRLEVDLLSRRSALHLDAGRRGLTGVKPPASFSDEFNWCCFATKCFRRAKSAGRGGGWGHPGDRGNVGRVPHGTFYFPHDDSTGSQLLLCVWMKAVATPWFDPPLMPSPLKPAATAPGSQHPRKRQFWESGAKISGLHFLCEGTESKTATFRLRPQHVTIGTF